MSGLPESGHWTCPSIPAGSRQISDDDERSRARESRQANGEQNSQKLSSFGAQVAVPIVRLPDWRILLTVTTARHCSEKKAAVGLGPSEP